MTQVGSPMYHPDAEAIEKAHVKPDDYARMYENSIADPDAFWRNEARRVEWIKPFNKVKNTNFSYPNVSIKWFEDGTLNVAANCVDRHLDAAADRTAIIWEPDDPGEDALRISYRELHANVCRMANVLKDLGVSKGDRVILYLPMIPEAAYAMLACARIGAVHSIVFAGFSSDALASRISDCGAKVVITADEAPRGGRRTPLKKNADSAISGSTEHVKALVVRRTGADIPWREGQDFDYGSLASAVSDE